MAVTSVTDVAQRLLACVDAEHGDQVATVMKVPVSNYLDAGRWQREMEAIFHRVPLLVALSCDIPHPGDHVALEIAERPILVVRGDDNVARAFLNICRHRGAPLACLGFGNSRRFTCPYHAWVYDNSGTLVGMAGKDTFGDIDVTGLVPLPTAERSGAVFAITTPGLTIDLDEWLGDMADALALLQLDKLHRYDVMTELTSGNWKATADGYVDGYHIGYLHRNNIGMNAITNRNTYETFGPHVRIGFASKKITEVRDQPVEEWPIRQVMSLVHFVFPNVSIAGLPDHPLMVSRLLPGPTVDRSTVVAYHYFRDPVVGEEPTAAAEERRLLYAAVTRDEDFSTVMKITGALPAMRDDYFRFGRNEVGNQNVHSWVDKLLAEAR